MKNITIRPEYLPDTLSELSTFVLVGREKLNAVRAEIRAIDRVQLAREVRDQKMDEARMLSEALLDAEVRLGEMTKNIPKASGGDRRSGKFKNDSGVAFDRGALNDSSVARLNESHSAGAKKSKHEIVRDLGFTPKQVERFETLADNPDIVAEVKARARENDDIPTRTEVLNLAKFRKKKAQATVQASMLSDKILDTLLAVMRLDVSSETLDQLANYCDSTDLSSHLSAIEGAQITLNQLQNGLLSRKGRTQ